MKYVIDGVDLSAFIDKRRSSREKIQRSDVFEPADFRNREKRNRKHGKLNVDTGFTHEAKNLKRPQPVVIDSHVRESRTEGATQSSSIDYQIANINLKFQWANNLDAGVKRMLYDSLGDITDTKESLYQFRQFVTKSNEKI